MLASETISLERQEKVEARSFESVFDENKNKLFGLVMGIVQQVEDTEEIVQDVFVKLYQNK